MGGSGPRFYLFEEKHSCSETWFFHVLMLNNWVPWTGEDFCLSDSWYLANDFWFMIFALNMVEQYYKNKKLFFILLIIMSLMCFGIQAV
jgi:hypothetical protein